MIEQIMIVALGAVLVVAVGIDLYSSKIPNWLTLSTISFAFSGHVWGDGLSGAIFSLAGAAVGLGIFIIPYGSGGMGAGDVKLMMTVGALVGPSAALVSSLLAFLVGGVYALGMICYHWRVTTAGRKIQWPRLGTINTSGLASNEDQRFPFRLRYGLAIAGGTLLFEIGIHPFGG